MKTKSYALGLFAAVLLGSSGTASAVTLRLDAFGLDGSDAFNVLFEDTGDGLLQFEEVLSSSGFVFPDGLAFPTLFGVPTIEGISTVGGPCGEPDRWCFINFDIGLSVSIDDIDFTYSIGPVAVDEPASLSLLVIALGVLGVRLRRRTTLGTPGV
jgi:hypothetical protein